MVVTYYAIEKGVIKECEFDTFSKRSINSKALYLCDINVSVREEAVDALTPFLEGSPILEYILYPSDHIRFEYMSELAYGEFAFFSSKSEHPIKYMAVIHLSNTLFLVNNLEDELFSEYYDTFKSLIENSANNLEVPFLLYLMINEILSENGKLILSYREEIEDAAKALNEEQNEVDIGEILEYRTHLSDFNRVLEKLNFTLNFPPAKAVLDPDSPYRRYFLELLKTVDVLKISVTKSEERLDALHDHYNLLLQDRANKRLNFLTIIQAIFVPLTLVTGIYGMNFVNMPELNWHYGYFFLLGVLVLIASVFMRYFYKNGWFD